MKVKSGLFYLVIAGSVCLVRGSHSLSMPYSTDIRPLSTDSLSGAYDYSDVQALAAQHPRATSGGQRPWVDISPHLPESGTSPSWQYISPLPGLNFISAAVWANGEFITADASGLVHASANGIDWSNYFTGDISFWRGIATNGSIYVGVSDNGSIWASSDARIWQQQTAYPEQFFDVIWDGSKFVAVGGNWFGDGSGDSAILTSADGVTWDERYSSTATPLLFAVEWNGSEYVAVGRLGTVITSVDALQWQAGSLGSSATVRGVAWGGDRFAAVTEAGSILTSSDGSSWTEVRAEDGYVLFDITWFNGSFVAGGTLGILVSSDGATWDQQAIDVSSDIYRLASSPDAIVAFTEADEVATSSNGVDWTTTSSSLTTETPTAIATDDVAFVVAGDGGSILRSIGTSTWEVLPSVLPFIANAIAWGNGKFVAVGDEGTIATSIDEGATWEVQSSPNTANFKGVTWGGGQFVVVGYQPAGAFGQAGASYIVTSSDGVNWVQQDGHVLPGDLLNAVVWSGSQFVAVGGDSGFAPPGGDGSNAAFTSPDGQGWTRSIVTDGHGPTFHSIASNGNILVAVGDAAGIPVDPRVIATSSDGVDWTFRPADPGVRSAGSLTSVAWTGLRFIAVGYDGTSLKSDDGLVWLGEDPGTGASFFAVAALNGQCVAGGYPALLMSNDNICRPDKIFSDGLESRPAKQK
ncbi:MAG: hypothetical protein ABI843_08935 [Dokdonella sp.]